MQLSSVYRLHCNLTWAQREKDRRTKLPYLLRRTDSWAGETPWRIRSLRKVLEVQSGGAEHRSPEHTEKAKHASVMPVLEGGDRRNPERCVRL